MTSPIDPATATTVIMNLFLYLKTFLAVDLYLKDNLFHINGIFSIITFLPDAGDFGLRRSAGVSPAVLSPARIVAATAAKTIIAKVIMKNVTPNTADSGGITKL